MLAKDVLKDARRLLDWEQVAADLQVALDQATRTFGDWEDYTEIGDIVVSVDWQDDTQMIASCFIGTVFSLTPSGKFYTPWANGNVEDCPRCHGSGHTANGKDCTWCSGLGSREAYLDDLWTQEVDRVSYRFGVFVFSGEGDPCDLFIGMVQDVPEREDD